MRTRVWAVLLLGVVVTAQAQERDFIEGPRLGGRRTAPTATVLTDGRILVVGGQTDGPEFLKTAVLIDPKSRTVTPTGSLATGRWLHTATRLKDGRVLIVGGMSNESGQPGAVASAEIYDPSSGQFSAAGTMITARSQPAAALLDSGLVLVCGGLGAAQPGGTFQMNASAELFDPATRTFTRVGDMTAPRVTHTATLLATGDVLVVGFGSADLFVSSTNQFVRLPAEGTPRARHTATRLSDGRVLLVGGSYGNNTLGTAELYDPAARQFRGTGSLHAPRTDHTATLLEDGRVLINGGVEFVPTSSPSGSTSYTGTLLSTPEIYDAARGQFVNLSSSRINSRRYSAAVAAGSEVWVVGGGWDESEIYTIVPSTPQPPVFSRVERPILHVNHRDTAAGSPEFFTQATKDDSRPLQSFAMVSAIWSPDGRRFAGLVESQTGAFGSVQIAQLDGPALTVFNTANDEALVGLAPAWSPDGKSLAVFVMKESTKQANGLEYSMVVVNADTKSVQYRMPIPEGTLLVPRHLSPPDKVRWSPNGRFLLISWEKAVVLDLQRRIAIEISREPIVAEWMPDGNSVIYFEIANWSQRRNRSLGGIYLRNLSARDRVELAAADVLAFEGFALHSSMHNGLLVLSPSKKKIAFLTGATGTERSMLRLYEIGPTGRIDLSSPTTKLMIEDIVVDLQWAPDESVMAALTIPRTAVLRQGPFGRPTIKTLDPFAREWHSVKTIDFDLAAEWPDSLEFLMLLKMMSWTR